MKYEINEINFILISPIAGHWRYTCHRMNIYKKYINIYIYTIIHKNTNIYKNTHIYKKCKYIQEYKYNSTYIHKNRNIHKYIILKIDTIIVATA